MRKGVTMKYPISGTSYQRIIDTTCADYIEGVATGYGEAFDREITSQGGKNVTCRRVGKTGQSCQIELSVEAARDLARYLLDFADVVPYVDPEVRGEYAQIVKDGERLARLLK